MQADAVRTQAPQVGGAFIILVLRRNSRKFDRGTEIKLSSHLKNIDADFQVVKYFGNITQAESIALFSRASGVIGYVGAGFVNTLFASNPQCVVEISTDEASSSESGLSLYAWNPPMLETLV